jgi:hypothetical protein
MALSDERFFLVGRMNNERIDIAVCSEIERSTRSYRNVFHVNSVQGLELLDQDVKQPRVPHGGGGAQSKFGIR